MIKHVQPDGCQQRQKVRDDVSLHRLCRFGGQNREQAEEGELGRGKELTNKWQMETETGET